jgi:PAS domain S-box-containing protein
MGRAADDSTGQRSGEDRETGAGGGIGTAADRFRLLVHAVRDYAIYMLDPDGAVVSWNEGAERIKGYTADEIIGRNFSLFYTAEDREAGRPAAALATAAAEGVFRDENWRVRRDGARFWAHVTITALRAEDGELLGFAKVTRDLTDRRRVEEALRESEERFRQLAENAREVFWLYSVDFSELLYISPAVSRLWGIDAEALATGEDSWFRLLHPEDQPAMHAFQAELRERRAAIRYRIRREDGEERWLLTRAFPVRDRHGQVVRIGGVTEDVTEQVETEDRLRFLAEAGHLLSESIEFEETLRTVARLAVPRVADWCVVDVLEGGEIHRLGVAHTDPEKEALAWEVVRRFPPDPSAGQGVAEVIRTGRPSVIPDIPDSMLRLVARDEEHLALVRKLGLRSSMILPMKARGRVLGAIAFIRAESGRRFSEEDLTFAEEIAGRAALAVDNARLYREAQATRGEAERRAQQEEALRRTAQGVAGTFEEMGVIRAIVENAIVATNADGAFVKRIDASTDEVVVVACAGHLTPPVGSRGPFTDSYARRAIERGEPLLVPALADAPSRTLAFLLQHCDDCSAMIVPLFDAGTAIGVLVLVRLDQRQSFRPDELARAQTFGDLASLGFRKIHLLKESESRREELEEAIESRARLVRGFSHDLKNPLGAADGYLQILEAGIISDPDRVELSIARARRAMRSALDLINDLAHLAQAEAGHIDVDPVPVDVREIATELAEEYRAQAQAKGLEVDCRMPDRVPIIRSDSTRIRQILGNLISNAVKYTDEGEIRVSVESRRAAPPGPGRWLAVSVRDTGRGIPRDRQHLLFREFSRIDPAGIPGVGLGLAISQRVAAALGGCIRVHSDAGQGATFTLWLPC